MVGYKGQTGDCFGNVSETFRKRVRIPSFVHYLPHHCELLMASVSNSSTLSADSSASLMFGNIKRPRTQEGQVAAMF